MKQFKKQLNKYIRENLRRGYSLEQIERAFIKYGYEKDFSKNCTREYKIRDRIIKTIPVFLGILLLLIISVFIYTPGITTLAVVTKQYDFTDKIDLRFNKSSDYIWNLENEGILKSVRLSGEVKTNGTVKVYLEHENKAYLIFDNKRLGGGLESITGLTVKEKEIEVETTGNITVEEQVIINNLINSINETKNDVGIEIEIKDNKIDKSIVGNLNEVQELLIDSLIEIFKGHESKIKVKINSEFQRIELPEEAINDLIANETLIDGTLNITEPINETLNITLPLNETINITPIMDETAVNETQENIIICRTIKTNLEYKKDALYDVDDKGIESIKGIVDLTVENSGFSWNVDESRLCTLWRVYSVEDEESTIFCYGSSKCCNFVDLLPSRVNWDDVFYSVYGQNGIGLDNLVSAQVLYIDYNLSLDEPYSDICYSEWKNLSVVFYEGFISFEDVCIGTCVLPNLNATNFKLIIEVNNSELSLDSITYYIDKLSTNNIAPVLLKNVSNISFFKGKDYVINLSEYFYDSDNDTLTFGFYNNSKINTRIIDETAGLSSDNFTGTTYMFFTANDFTNKVVSNIFKVEIKEQKLMKGNLKSLREVIKLR